MGPKEDEESKRDRLRQRKSAMLDRRKSAEESATGLTTDLRAVYGLRGLSMFGNRGTSTTPPPAAPKPRVSSSR